jgi:hypothetical protein
MSIWWAFGKNWRRALLWAVAGLVAACGSVGPSGTPVSYVSLSSTQSPSFEAGATPAVPPEPNPTAFPTARQTASPPAAAWQPSIGDTLQVQYSGTISLSVDATIYDLDADDTPASTVAALHARGRHVFCYIDAGAWENYRSDASRFPAAVLGKAMDGWPDERWLDIRKVSLLAPLLRHRLDTCVAKGFDGVDPDNVNGYTNATGFPLKAADQLAFNRWLADQAHSRHLAVALKNDGEQAAALAPVFDAAVVEECVEYSECAQYGAFVKAGKPVFDIEYARAPSAYCPVAAKLRFAIIGKHLALDAYRTHC